MRQGNEMDNKKGPFQHRVYGPFPCQPVLFFSIDKYRQFEHEPFGERGMENRDEAGDMSDCYFFLSIFLSPYSLSLLFFERKEKRIQDIEAMTA